MGFDDSVGRDGGDGKRDKGKFKGRNGKDKSTFKGKCKCKGIGKGENKGKGKVKTKRGCNRVGGRDWEGDSEWVDGRNERQKWEVIIFFARKK